MRDRGYYHTESSRRSLIMNRPHSMRGPRGGVSNALLPVALPLRSVPHLYGHDSTTGTGDVARGCLRGRHRLYSETSAGGRGNGVLKSGYFKAGGATSLLDNQIGSEDGNDTWAEGYPAAGKN